MLWGFKERRSRTVGQIRKAFMERTVFEMDSRWREFWPTVR